MSAANTCKPTQETNLVLLQETYATMRSTYDNLSRWAALLLGAWAVLMGIVIARPFAKSTTGLLLVLSGVVLLVLWHEFKRGGQGLTGLWSVAMALERELGVLPNRSHTIAGLAAFRDKKMVDELTRLSQIDDQAEWLRELSDGKHAIFQFDRSWTIRFVSIGGVGLVIVGLVMTFVAFVMAVVGFLQCVLPSGVP